MYYALFCAVVISAYACKNEVKNTELAKSENTAMDTVLLPPVVIVSEETIYDIPLPKAEEKESAKKTETQKKVSPTKSSTAKVSHQTLKQSLATANITPAKTIDTTFFSFLAEPINKVLTITSYEKKGTEVLQVVSSPTDPDEIDYIIFTDKNNNTDIYGVSSGLTAKEAKSIRKDLKHFEKKGKVFLYTEDSNILYELDGVTSQGKAVTEDDIDNMHISSIIWKEKAGKDLGKTK